MQAVTPILMKPIGVVASSRAEPIDDEWDAVSSHILIDGGQFTADAVAGLDAFSHLEVLYHFDRVAEPEIERGARPPAVAPIGRSWGYLPSAGRAGPTASPPPSAASGGLTALSFMSKDSTPSTGRRCWMSSP